MQNFDLRPWAYKLAGTVEQTVGYKFSLKGKKKKKFQLVKPNAQLSIKFPF